MFGSDLCGIKYKLSGGGPPRAPSGPAKEVAVHEAINTGSLQRPNFLILMVDEERYPPVYESPAIQEWRKHNLLTQELLRDHGLEFKRHYAASTACSPSRATLFTGQYPSLHGVSQTSGVAKSAFNADIFWLDPNTVPTMGNYFRADGYRTFYKGKWHISEEDILIPGPRIRFPATTPLAACRRLQKIRFISPLTASKNISCEQCNPFTSEHWLLNRVADQLTPRRY